MLKMADETKAYLQKVCPDILPEEDNLDLILDRLDDLMLDSLDENYSPTADTASVIRAYDDLFYNND